MLVKVLEIKDFYESARCSNTIVSTCHVSVDSSTNAHNQTILDVAVPVSQIGIDARILL